MRMRKVTCFCVGVALIGAALLAALSAAEEGRGRAGAATRVLIVYHGGTPPWHGSAPLEQEDVHALTQATTQPINVASVADRIRQELAARGCVVDLRRATDVEGPDEFLPYDGIIFGTPTWFSNVAYPVKRLFDEHLIRIYEHRDGKLNDKVLSGFVTVMEGGRERAARAAMLALGPGTPVEPPAGGRGRQRVRGPGRRQRQGEPVLPAVRRGAEEVTAAPGTTLPSCTRDS